MYALKIIRHENSEGRLLTHLLSGDEVTYETVNYSTKKDFDESVSKLFGKSEGFTFLADEKQVPDKGSYVRLTLFQGDKCQQYLIQLAWIYVMLNGKTIDKITI